MAPALKRKGIAIPNRQPAKRRKSIPNPNRSSTTRSDQQLPPGFRDGEWPLKRILKERGDYYLEHEEDVGTAAKEEWEAEKGQKEVHSPVLPHRKQTVSHTRDEYLPRPRRGSRTIARDGEETPRVSKRRSVKRRLIPDSSSSPEIPETQREVVSKPGIAVEIYRRADFNSQDWPTLASSQNKSAVATQDTDTSKDTAEGDSTLGSSLPPDSPIEIPASNPLNQESSSQALPSYLAPGSGSGIISATSTSISKQPVSSAVGLPGVEHSSQAKKQNLLVVRSDSPGERGAGPSHSVEVSGEQRNNSSPWSPLFVGEEDLDLQPISDPNRLEEAIGTEGELHIPPPVRSSVPPENHNSVQLRANHSYPDFHGSSPAVKSYGGKSLRNRALKTSQGDLRHQEAPQSSSLSIRSLRGTPSRFAHINSSQSSTSNLSQPLHTQTSPANATSTKSKRLGPTLRVQTARNSTVTVSGHSRASAASSSPLRVRTALSANQPPKILSQSQHISSHRPDSPQASAVSSTSYKMPNSEGGSSPRVRKPPATPEMAPQSELREKLRQIRATSRANQNNRLKTQQNSGSSKSPTTKDLETRSSRRLSPDKNVESPVALSTPTQDQPIPSLENVEGPPGEMEVDKDDTEPNFSSSLAPLPPVLNAVVENRDLPTQGHEVEKNIPELDIPTMPLLQPCEFVVPLPIDGRIKHQYIAALREKWKDINDFLHFPKSQRLIDSMTDMIKQLNNTVVHTDLGLDGPATQVAPTTEEVEWAQAASSKFAFLGKLISELRDSDHHVVIAARRGPTWDLLKTYLRGKGLNMSVYSDGDYEGNVDGMTQDIEMGYSLLPTEENAMKHVHKDADLIIAFDDSFDASMLPEWCTSRFVPVILLLVVNSAEHVGRCIPPDFPEPERLRRLIKAVVHVHKDVGEMPFHLDLRHAYNLDPGARVALVKKDLGAKIAHAAARTAEALLSENFALNFNLQPIVELDLAGLEDQPPSTEESKEVSSSASRAGTPSGHKRLRDERSSSAIQSKRQRMTPLGDITHITDSAKTALSQTQIIDDLKSSLKRAHQDLTSERQFRLKAEETTTYLQTRLREIESSLGSLQSRYETRTKQVHTLQRENKRLLAEAESESQRFQKLQAENIGLKDQRMQLQEDLRLARQALETSSVPAVAELASAQAMARRAEEVATAARRTVESLRKDFEFTRDQYQDASTKAADHACQVSELERENEELKRQAGEERRRLLEVNVREGRRRDLERVREVEAERERLEAVLARVEEENRLLKSSSGKGGRGGVVTRAGSVQPSNGGGGGAGSGAGSRSPRPGVLGVSGGTGGGSRGASPAPSHVGVHSAVHGGRASALRNER